MRYLKLAATASLSLAVLLTSNGCNLWGGIDKPKTNEEVVQDSQAKLDSNNISQCNDAVGELLAAPNPNDDVYRRLGWAYLCQAGASAGAIAANSFSFQSTSSNYTGVGILANAMAATVPQTAATVQLTQLAANAFSNIYATSENQLNQGLAYFAQAAAYIGKQSVNQAAVTRSNISVGACLIGNCATASAANCTAGMSDADADGFFTAINNGLTAIGGSGNTSLQNVQSFINQIQSLLGAAAGASAEAAGSRCVIYNQILTQ
jgi:hypothetical protein